MTHRFLFNIAPLAKGRPRSFIQRGRLIVTTPPATRVFERTVAQLAKAQHKGPPIEGPLYVACDFFIEKPKSVKRRYPSVAPDVDNYAKAALDALNGIVWMDDSQIVDLRLCKRYADPGKSRIEILVQPVEIQKPAETK